MKEKNNELHDLVKHVPAVELFKWLDVELISPANKFK